MAREKDTARQAVASQRAIASTAQERTADTIWGQQPKREEQPAIEDTEIASLYGRLLESTNWVGISAHLKGMNS